MGAIGTAAARTEARSQSDSARCRASAILSERSDSGKAGVASSTSSPELRPGLAGRRHDFVDQRWFGPANEDR